MQNPDLHPALQFQHRTLSKGPILENVGQFSFGGVGQFYIVADKVKQLRAHLVSISLSLLPFSIPPAQAGSKSPAFLLREM
jgi:hypothetical protein